MHKIECVRRTPPFPTKGSGQEVGDEPVMRDDHVLVVGELLQVALAPLQHSFGTAITIRTPSTNAA
jgi:hypothetical protein